MRANNLSVLIVDDNVHMLRILATMVRGYGFDEVHMVQDPADAPKPPTDPPAKGGGAGKAFGAVGVIGVALVALLLVCGVGGLVTCLWTSSGGVEVKGHSWERAIAIETYKTTRKDDWCDDVPAKARVVNTSEKKKRTKKVKDGEDCKTVKKDQGDGTFKKVEKCTPRYREEPVMAKWCRYELDSWVVTDTEKLAGRDRDPTWPKVHVDSCQRIGCTRKGKKKETYRVHLEDEDGGAHTCDIKEMRWKGMEPGSRWVAQIGVVDGSVRCDTLTAP